MTEGSPAQSCVQGQWLRDYLNVDFDPYDFDWAVERWRNSQGYRSESWESYDDIPEELRGEFSDWARGPLLQQLHQHDPLSVPAYIFFEKARMLPPGSWLVHFSKGSFLSFRRGATLETLALSTHANPHELKSCEANLSEDSGLFEVVYGFAMDVEDMHPRSVREMAKGYGRHVVLFQCDCAVKAYHNTDMQEQAIFPLCSEYNVYRGTVDSGGHVTFLFSAEDGDVEYDDLANAVADAEAGKLVPNRSKAR